MTTPTTAENLAERFWKKVRHTSKCWVWLGARQRQGYGTMRYGGHEWMAHRLAFTLAIGPIPEGRMVCHTCDHPWCVRPDHLFLGSAKDNQQDMTDKGRGRAGERNGRAKLTREQADWIRENYSTLPRGQRRETLRTFGVTPRIAYLILKGEIWR